MTSAYLRLRFSSSVPPQILLVVLAGVLQVTAAALTSADPNKASGLHLDQLPLTFELNKGQAPNGVEFVARGNYSIFLQNDRVVLAFPEVRNASDKSTSRSSALTLQLLHPNPSSRAQTLDLLPGKTNYFVGKQSEKWITAIPQYARVAFDSVYDGVDVIYYGNRGQLEYDFVIHPGADASQVRVRISGGDRLELTPNGDLEARIGTSKFELHKPTIYQTKRNGDRQLVAGTFVLHGNELSLGLGEYDHTRQLIIDPVLSYSTLIGANNSTQVQGVAADTKGNLYITGTTFATDYPTVNAFQSSNNGTTNVFVTKLNPSGNAILYSTYIGSGGFDNAAGIAVDVNGNAYVTGTVGASNFPTTAGSFMTSCGGVCNTPFVSKFLSDGSLAFSTFMGGSHSPAHAIAVDAEGNAYIAGDTGSDDLPTTAGALEPVYPGYDVHELLHWVC